MNTELIKVEAVQELVQTAPAALTKNNNIMLAGIKQADELIAKIQTIGMSDDLDQACNDWQVRAKKGITMMDEARKPITQMLDAIKKKFTELEAPLDPKKSDSVYSKIQAFRNDYAKKKALEEQKRQEEIKKKQRHELEINSIKSYYNQSITQAEIQLRYKRKGFLSKILESATLADIDDVKTKLNNIPLSLSISRYNEIEIPNPSLIYVAKEEALELLSKVKSEMFLNLSNIHESELLEFKNELLDLIRSKKIELQEIENAKTDALKQAALQKQQAERKADEEEKLRKQQQEAKEKAEAEALLNKEIENANTLFDAANNLAEGASESNATVRQQYKIIVTSPVGFQQVAAFWFQKEGLTLSVEAIEKKSLGQMKTFCEKHFHKTGEKIESSALKYEQDFKAIATKS